jgi:hypothetical protein
MRLFLKIISIIPSKQSFGCFNLCVERFSRAVNEEVITRKKPVLGAIPIINVKTTNLF